MSTQGHRQTPLYCIRCGREFDWCHRGAPPKLCPDCKAGKPHASTARDGVFAGMSLEQIAALAREHHMSYGRYRALAEAQGRLDVVI